MRADVTVRECRYGRTFVGRIYVSMPRALRLASELLTSSVVHLFVRLFTRHNFLNAHTLTRHIKQTRK